MVKELSDQVQERRALIEGLGKKAKELFEPSVEEVRKTIDLLRQKFSEFFDAISSKYEEYAKKFGELKAGCGKLEEELRLARIVQSLIKYPPEYEKLHIYYDILMLGAIMNHCMVKGVNPKVGAGDLIYSKYNIYSTRRVELDLLE
jgi:predicted nuclease with TOPRIM domain